MGKNKIIVLVDSNIYSLEAIYSAAYLFLDDAYFYLEEESKSKIKVNIKSKDSLSEKKMEILKGEFLNELLNSALREKISKNNKKMREYILGKVLSSALSISSEQKNILNHCSEEKGYWNKDDLKREFEQSLDNDWEKDLEEISIPWEEKNSSSSKINNKEKDACIEDNLEDSSKRVKKNKTSDKKNTKNKKKLK